MRQHRAPPPPPVKVSGARDATHERRASHSRDLLPSRGGGGDGGGGPPHRSKVAARGGSSSPPPRPPASTVFQLAKALTADRGGSSPNTIRTQLSAVVSSRSGALEAIQSGALTLLVGARLAAKPSSLVLRHVPRAWLFDSFVGPIFDWVVRTSGGEKVARKALRRLLPLSFDCLSRATTANAGVMDEIRLDASWCGLRLLLFMGRPDMISAGESGRSTIFTLFMRSSALACLRTWLHCHPPKSSQDPTAPDSSAWAWRAVGLMLWTIMGTTGLAGKSRLLRALEASEWMPVWCAGVGLARGSSTCALGIASAWIGALTTLAQRCDVSHHPVSLQVWEALAACADAEEHRLHADDMDDVIGVDAAADESTAMSPTTGATDDPASPEPIMPTPELVDLVCRAAAAIVVRAPAAYTALPSITAQRHALRILAASSGRDLAPALGAAVLVARLAKRMQLAQDALLIHLGHAGVLPVLASLTLHPRESPSAHVPTLLRSCFEQPPSALHGVVFALAPHCAPPATVAAVAPSLSSRDVPALVAMCGLAACLGPHGLSVLREHPGALMQTVSALARGLAIWRHSAGMRLAHAKCRAHVGLDMLMRHVPKPESSRHRRSKTPLGPIHGKPLASDPLRLWRRRQSTADVMLSVHHAESNTPTILRAHSFVLAHASFVWAQSCQAAAAVDDLFTLPVHTDQAFHTVRCLVKFCYTQKLPSLNRTEAVSLMRLAASYHVWYCVERCGRLLAGTVSRRNVLSLLRASHEAHCIGLRDACARYLLSHWCVVEDKDDVVVVHEASEVRQTPAALLRSDGSLQVTLADRLQLPSVDSLHLKEEESSSRGNTVSSTTAGNITLSPKRVLFLQQLGEDADEDDDGDDGDDDNDDYATRDLDASEATVLRNMVRKLSPRLDSPAKQVLGRKRSATAPVRPVAPSLVALAGPDDSEDDVASESSVSAHGDTSGADTFESPASASNSGSGSRNASDKPLRTVARRLRRLGQRFDHEHPPVQVFSSVRRRSEGVEPVAGLDGGSAEDSAGTTGSDDKVLPSGGSGGDGSSGNSQGVSAKEVAGVMSRWSEGAMRRKQKKKEQQRRKGHKRGGKKGPRDSNGDPVTAKSQLPPLPAIEPDPVAAPSAHKSFDKLRLAHAERERLRMLSMLSDDMVSPRQSLHEAHPSSPESSPSEAAGTVVVRHESVERASRGSMDSDDTSEDPAVEWARGGSTPRRSNGELSDSVLALQGLFKTPRWSPKFGRPKHTEVEEESSSETESDESSSAPGTVIARNASSGLSASLASAHEATAADDDDTAAAPVDALAWMQADYEVPVPAWNAAKDGAHRRRGSLYNALNMWEQVTTAIEDAAADSVRVSQQRPRARVYRVDMDSLRKGKLLERTQRVRSGPRLRLWIVECLRDWAVSLLEPSNPDMERDWIVL